MFPISMEESVGLDRGVSMKREQSPFPPAWWGTSLENVGLQEQRPDVGTYGCYAFANLPDLPVPLDGNFGWLAEAPAHEYHVGTEGAVEHARQVAKLVEACSAAGVSLPCSFLKFMQEPELQRRIRSNTHCLLNVAEGPVASPVGEGTLVRFLADSQGCVFWYLYVLAGSADHAIVSSPDFYDPSGETLDDKEPDPGALVFGAELFEAFLCRFWIENELWFSGYEGTPISAEGRRYLDLYRKSQPHPLTGRPV